MLEILSLPWSLFPYINYKFTLKIPLTTSHEAFSEDWLGIKIHLYMRHKHTNGEGFHWRLANKQ